MNSNLKPSQSNIIDFLIETTGVKSINEHTDILEDAGCYGDDWHEMIDNYSSQFSVDLSNYLWYFHTPEEGSGIKRGVLFFAPNLRVQRIKITPKDLFEMAQKGVWTIEYPDHSLP